MVSAGAARLASISILSAAEHRRSTASSINTTGRPRMAGAVRTASARGSFANRAAHDQQVLTRLRCGGIVANRPALTMVASTSRQGWTPPPLPTERRGLQSVAWEAGAVCSGTLATRPDERRVPSVRPSC